MFLKDENGEDTNVLDSAWLNAEVSTYPALYGCQVKKNGWYHINTRQVLCQYKNCTIYICNDCGKLDGGVGPMGCPCDLTPGWRAAYYEGMGKPRPPVLPKGKRRDRIQRSIVRHQLPEWAKQK